MTASVNKVLLIGRLARDPELRFTPEGIAVCRLSVLTESIDAEESGRSSRRQWHRVVVEGRSAETLGDLLRRGDEVLVEGRLRTRHWKDRVGRGPDHAARASAHVEIIATELQPLHAEAERGTCGPASAEADRARTASGTESGEQPPGVNPEPDLFSDQRANPRIDRHSDRHSDRHANRSVEGPSLADSVEKIRSVRQRDDQDGGGSE